MATVKAYTDPYISMYRRVPPAGKGVCAVCHSGPNAGYSTCNSCARTMGQVSYPVRAILPISLCRTEGQLYANLRNYKNGTPRVQQQCGVIIAATLARFAQLHWSCIAGLLGGPPTVITTVPSTRAQPRLGEHPLIGAVRRSGTLASLYRPLLVRGAGPAEQRRAGDDVFAVTADVTAERVLLIEDTLASGARAQSAASALRLGGAKSVAVVVIGRVIDPEWNENCGQIWSYAEGVPFSFDVCCLCDPARVGESVH